MRRDRWVWSCCWILVGCTTVIYFVLERYGDGEYGETPQRLGQRTDTCTVSDSFFIVAKLKWLRDHIDASQEHAELLSRTTETSRKKSDFAPTPLDLPTYSDVICQGNNRKERTCRFRNLCMETKGERFFILKGQRSFFFNVPHDLSKDFLDLTTLDEHNVFYWRYEEEVPSDFFAGRMDRLRVRTIDVSKPKPLIIGERKLTLDNDTIRTNLTIVKGRTFLTKRFYPLNIMHIFHDDWLGLFHLRTLWPSLMDTNECFDVGEGDTPSRHRHGLVVFDHYTRQKYDEVYEWLGNFYTMEELLGWSRWEVREQRPNAYICFDDAIVGNHKGMAWYQYGYDRPQGPIPEHTATGYELREAAVGVFRQLGLPSWNQANIAMAIDSILFGSGPAIATSDGPCIAIFARRSNRLVLNEHELGDSIEEAFGLPICWIRLEDHPIPELIALLRNAVAAFGMHGSILVLAMFMPPGSALIEGFPYGVPADNYTPYKTMVNLPGQKMAYRAWTPAHSNASVGHPDRPAHEGGIRHLNSTYQQFILESSTIPPHLCCDNPHWLYRIFQDTTVESREIISLIRDALLEAAKKLSDNR